MYISEIGVQSGIKINSTHSQAAQFSLSIQANIAITFVLHYTKIGDESDRIDLIHIYTTASLNSQIHIKSIPSCLSLFELLDYTCSNYQDSPS